ncbi:MAG: FAD-binding oxidoreductase [Kiritimatiellia bacterium]
MQVLEPDGFLADESRLQGHAVKAFVVQLEEEIVTVLSDATSAGIAVTTQGGLTGITGAAVPQEGYVLRVRQMQRVLGLRRDARGFVLRLEPGCTLDSIRRMLLEPAKMDVGDWSPESLAAWRALCHAPPQMFAPDLTETGATLGGVVSTNGSGARSYRYGAARGHIEGLRIVLMNGDILDMRRGQHHAQGRNFCLPGISGRIYAGKLPDYSMPAVKHAAGLYACENMDLLDLFIGSEGTLGVISQVEIRLIPRPERVYGLTMFLPSEAAALSLVEQVRGSDLAVQAIEYFSAEALDLLRGENSVGSEGGVRIPPLAAHWHTAIYIEVGSEDASVMDEMVCMLESVGGDADATWLADGYQEIETLKGIRHAIPERINSWIAEQRKAWPAVTKLGTDLAVPDRYLRAVMQMYHHDLQAAGLSYVIFGHIGNNHVHVNILPRNVVEWQAGKQLYAEWARRVIAWGGTVSAEHGIGKLKVDMLRMLFGADGIAAMQAVKRMFDPAFLLNRGTLFPADCERLQGNR